MGSDDVVDSITLKHFNMKDLARFELLKKSERVQFMKQRVLEKKPLSTQIPKKMAPYEARPEALLSTSTKFSLSFLLKNTDEMTIAFAKKELFKVLKALYGDEIDEMLFTSLCDGFKKQKPQHVAQMRFEDKKDQKRKLYKVRI